MITAAGSGSGLDIESIVSQLMTLEQRPILDLEQRRQALDIQLSDAAKLRGDIENLSSAAETLSNASLFGAWETTSDNEDVVTSNNTDGLIAEAHSIEVQALATSHRLISDPFTSPDDDFGTGEIQFTAADETFSITLASGESTLADLRDAINAADDNNQVIASLINTDSGTSLILTATETGTANTITADTTGTGRPAAFSNFNTATDAELTIDGLAITSDSNTLTDTVPGLSLELHSIGSANVSSSQDTISITENLEAFAASYNTLSSTMGRLSDGSFQGDSINRRIETRLREEFFKPVVTSDTSTTSLFDFGFTFDRDGALSVNDEVLDSRALANTQSLVNAFTDPDTGFGVRIVNTLANYTDAEGFFDGRADSIESRKSTIDKQIERLEARMESIESRFRRQFSAMDITVSQLQSSSDYLFQAISSS